MTTTESSRILIVDDVDDNLLLLQIFLIEEGYQVEAANSAAVALTILRALPIDLILLDVMMPQMDGYELTRIIRQDAQLCSIPIILVTAHAGACRIKGLAVGATDFTRKPLDFEALILQMTHILKRSSSSKEEVPRYLYETYQLM